MSLRKWKTWTVFDFLNCRYEYERKVSGCKFGFKLHYYFGIVGKAYHVICYITHARVRCSHQFSILWYLGAEARSQSEGITNNSCYREYSMQVVLFSDKKDVPAPLKALSTKYRKRLSFAFVEHSETSLKKRFGVSECVVVCLFSLRWLLFPIHRIPGLYVVEDGKQVGVNNYTPVKYNRSSNVVRFMLWLTYYWTIPVSLVISACTCNVYH